MLPVTLVIRQHALLPCELLRGIRAALQVSAVLLLQVPYVESFEESSARCRKFDVYACEFVVCVSVQQRANLDDSHRGQDNLSYLNYTVVAEILFKRVGQAIAAIPFSDH